ncbi:hypothetical protein AQUCO_05400050v1 [Aquilegia coerulea]|uniref:Uncharacterized protein n=1 Tax=Aquilegia coerulea TaxID=218851 RepID=A0A2G5CHB8_AQUCA|nr:hypothetical protein AQUCO_05400050v1 [Aquilegia coerulea]
MLSCGTNYPATMLLSCKSGGFEVLKSSDLSKNQNEICMQSLMMSNSCTPAENLLLIVELRKKILTFRDIIDLPPCDDHGPINELVSGTVEDLHKLYPKVVPRISMSELTEASTHQVLSKLYNALTSIGDSWVNNHKWMSKFKCEKEGDIKNISLGQLGDRVLAKLDYMIMVARELFDVMDENGRNSDVSPRNSTFGDILMESYSDTKASLCRSPNTPTSVIPEFASTFADVSYSPPLLWPLRLQAVGKLKPIDVKRLSFHILPHAVACNSGPEHARRTLDEVEPEKKRARSSSKSMALTDTNMEVKGPKDTEAAREVPMSNLNAVSCSRSGVENSVAPSTPKAPPLPPPMPGIRRYQESQKMLLMKATDMLPQSVTQPSNVSRVPTPLPGALPPSPMIPSNACSVAEAPSSSPTAFTTPPPPPPMLQETVSATPPYVVPQSVSATPAPPSPVPMLPKTLAVVASPPSPPPPPFTFSRNACVAQTPPPPPTLLTLSKNASAAPSFPENSCAPQPPPPPTTCSRNASESLTVAPPVVPLNASKAPLPPPPPMLQANTSTTLPPPPPPPMLQNKGSTLPPPPPPPMLQPNASRAPPPPPMLPSNGSVPSPPPPMSLSNGSAPPPPPPGAARALLRPKKANTKLKRSTHMGNLYRVLKGKVEGINQDNKASSPRNNIGGGAGGGKQSMADALAEMTKRSSYFQQIEEDVEKHSKTIMEVKTKINSFQTTDMTELLKFHQDVESNLEKLTDETQVC